MKKKKVCILRSFIEKKEESIFFSFESPVIMFKVIISILVSFLVVFFSTQMQFSSRVNNLEKKQKICESKLEKVDEVTSVCKTKSQELDNLIQESKVKLGLTPKEAVDALGNIIVRPTRSKKNDRDDLQRPQDTVVLLTPICFKF